MVHSDKERSRDSASASNEGDGVQSNAGWMFSPPHSIVAPPAGLRPADGPFDSAQGRLGVRPHTNPYTRPWSSMALATFRKPPMLAPFTRLPGVPYFSAVS